MLSDMPDKGVYGFEAIDETLPFIPLAARRALDTLGRKLSHEGWLSLGIGDRRRIVQAGAGDAVESDALSVFDRAVPPPSRMDPAPGPDRVSPARDLVDALDAARPLDDARWQALRPLDRYALAKCAAKPEKLARAYDEIVPAVRVTHLGSGGEARMVDVGARAPSARRALASAAVRTTRAVIEAIAAGAVAKGDVIAVARVAGILAAKRTPDLVPLCHPVQTTSVAVDFEPDATRGELRIRATVEAIDRTGVEMEAMVAASVSSLTVYDMIKNADRWATIGAVRLEAKSGGKSGAVVRPPEGSAMSTPLVAVRDGRLSVDEAVASVEHAGSGAVCVFLGSVRDRNEGRPVVKLEYEAYPSMAEAEMRRIADEICEEIPGVRLAVVHRTGALSVGDIAVVCAASAPHRAEAFLACRALIDRVKERAPIWKREHGPEGAYWVGWQDARCAHDEPRHETS
jgi:molybdopterin synthase catalytic subunit